MCRDVLGSPIKEIDYYINIKHCINISKRSKQARAVLWIIKCICSYMSKHFTYIKEESVCKKYRREEKTHIICV